MADTMQGLRRTCLCGEVTLEMGEVVVGGFTQRVRDKGSLIFIDLRDKSGIVQLVFDETTEKSVFEKAESVRSEYVLLAKGTVRARESVNTEIKTGGIEIVVTELRILSKAQTPPFEIVSNTKTNEELRLKYRYLDLRREPLQKNLMMRHEIAKAAREYFYANGFTEIETPMMIKSTPEGARDYIVPSRIHNGKFYALPQSPQMYKQLLMIAGMDLFSGNVIIDTTDEETILDGIARNYETGVMRRHLTGGWRHLVEFWDEAEKFHCDMVILHDDITCKGALGLTGVILDQAKEKQTKLMMVSNDMFDHRTISRADIRQQVNDYMYSVMQAEPLDASLLQYDDYEGW